MRVRYVGRLAARHLSRGDRALARIVLVPPFPRRYEPSGIGGAQEGSDLLVRDLAEVAVEGADRAEVARGSETHDPIGLALAPRGVLSASAQYWDAREKRASGDGPEASKKALWGRKVRLVRATPAECYPQAQSVCDPQAGTKGPWSKERRAPLSPKLLGEWRAWWPSRNALSCDSTIARGAQFCGPPGARGEHTSLRPWERSDSHGL